MEKENLKKITALLVHVARIDDVESHLADRRFHFLRVGDQLLSLSLEFGRFLGQADFW